MEDTLVDKAEDAVQMELAERRRTDLEHSIAEMKEKLNDADSRERILSQHLLDFQGELAELQVKHSEEVSALNKKADLQGIKDNKILLLADFVRHISSFINRATSSDAILDLSDNPRTMVLADHTGAFNSMSSSDRVSCLSITIAVVNTNEICL